MVSRKRMPRIAAVFCAVALAVFPACKKSSTTTTPELPGSIDVNSSPSGAQIFLDGVDTGKTTHSQLTNIALGSHTVKLVREGYQDFQQTVQVSAGATAQINAVLKPHSIAVTQPGTGTIWVARDEVAVRWTTGSPAESSAVSDKKAGLAAWGVTNVKIDLLEDGDLKTTAVASAPNTGEYLWRIPKNNGGGQEYRLKVAAQAEPAVYGLSEGFIICYDVRGTYNGTIKITRGSLTESVPITYSQTQTGKNVTGTWTAAQGFTGTVQGTVKQNKIQITVTLTGAAAGDYNGIMDIENDGDKLTLKFSGYTPVGLLTAEFAGIRASSAVMIPGD